MIRALLLLCLTGCVQTQTIEQKLDAAIFAAKKNEFLASHNCTFIYGDSWKCSSLPGFCIIRENEIGCVPQ